MASTILVTGTSGFLGGLLASHLRERASVVEVPGRDGFDARLDAAFANAAIDTIVHAGFGVDFAAGDAGDSANVRNTRRLAELAAARGVAHFVFLGAAGALGVSATPRARNEDHLGATDPGFEPYRDTRYIRDKIRCESLLREALPGALTTLYLTTVYGPGMKEATRQTLAGLRGPNPIALVPPGGTSFLGAADFLAALDRALGAGPAGPLVISSGNTAYADLYRCAARLLGVGWRKQIVPLPGATRGVISWIAGLGIGPAAGAAVVESAFGYKYYSCERARRRLGWRPVQSLEETLRAIF